VENAHLRSVNCAFPLCEQLQNSLDIQILGDNAVSKNNFEKEGVTTSVATPSFALRELTNPSSLPI
jgi:hypothetical protein